MKRWVQGVGTALAMGAGAAAAQAPGAADHASRAEIAAQVARMEQAMKPGQGFAWERLAGEGDAVAGLEIWRRPGKPAVHPTQAEYVTVVQGEGVLVSGGTLVDRAETQPDLVEGSRIEGGVSRPLRPGDVIMIPAGMPHWFGITGKELVLLGTKLRVVQGR